MEAEESLDIDKQAPVKPQNQREVGTKLQPIKSPALPKKPNFVPKNTTENSPEKATLARGRKPRQLPFDLIYQLKEEGWSSRDIALRLETKNIIVSYRTIQRFLAGERGNIV